MIRPRIFLVTDPAFPTARVVDVVRAAARGVPEGALAVQLRDKDESARRCAAAIALAPVCAEACVPLVVNDDLGLAVAVRAAGVHLPAHTSPSDLAAARAAFATGLLSTAAHDEAELDRALAAGVDAVLVSPIFATPGKGAPRGPAAIAEAVAAVARAASSTWVYALGGVDESCVAACASAGAHGVAVVRALLEAADPERVARALYAPFA